MTAEKKKYILKTIGKFAILIGVIAAIAIIFFLIFKLCGFTDMKAMEQKLGNSFWLYFVICILQAVQVVFIPISNQIITVPACLVFNDHLLEVFLASWIGIVLGTIALYFLGRYGGDKILKWLLSDEEKAEECKDFLNRGNWLYPIGMCIPIIPDDILTTLAGAAKYNFWFVLITSIITRGICCAGSVWGFGVLCNYWWGWVLIGVWIIVATIITYILFKRNKKKDKE